jgi:hypothetical protein
LLCLLHLFAAQRFLDVTTVATDHVGLLQDATEINLELYNIQKMKKSEKNGVYRSTGS